MMPGMNNTEPAGTGGPSDSQMPAPVDRVTGQPRDPEVGMGLTFPDAPKLALDELIGQLTAQAQAVLAAQGRLRALLRATAAVTGELTLPIVLRQVVEAARELVQARYCALGVITPDGQLEQFVHAGMDKQTVERIGQLPTGRGSSGCSSGTRNRSG